MIDEDEQVSYYTNKNQGENWGGQIGHGIIFELYSNRMELLKSKNFNAKKICVPNSSLPNILRL